MLEEGEEDEGEKGISREKLWLLLEKDHITRRFNFTKFFSFVKGKRKSQQFNQSGSFY